MYEQLFSTSQRSGRVSLSSLNNILSKGKISANHIEMASSQRKKLLLNSLERLMCTYPL